MGYRQWHSTSAVLEWFKGLEDKSDLEFFQYDIVSFYPSITEELFDDAMTFARMIVDIPKNIVARDSLLFHDGKVWQKKSDLFHVTMGAYDGAEVCELVSLFILDKMRSSFPEVDRGLYPL